MIRYIVNITDKYYVHVHDGKKDTIQDLQRKLTRKEAIERVTKLNVPVDADDYEWKKDQLDKMLKMSVYNFPTLYDAVRSAIQYLKSIDDGEIDKTRVSFLYESKQETFNDILDDKTRNYLEELKFNW